MISIPQTNPKAGYDAHKSDIDTAITSVLESGWYILGKCVKTFESEFSAWLGSHGTAIGVGSGTDAIVLALKASGIGSGHLVATVSHTAVATVAAIDLAGAEPLLVDIDDETLCMSAHSLRTALSALDATDRRRLRAIVPVHLYGYPADMAGIQAVADEFGLTVIEDCAQAHGAKIHGRTVGTIGQMATFSFYPTKNLGCLGDGGMVYSSDIGLAGQVAILREYELD